MKRQATLHRMVMRGHICPYGLRAKHLLESRGFAVDDRWLRTRAETDAFKAQNDVKTTPQTFIDGVQIGGYDDLRRHFGLKVADPDAVSYRPVAALFAMTALMALAASFAAFGKSFTMQAGEWFISFSMIILALLKLQDIDKFATMFLNYDLLARRWVPYATIYPFAEGLAGVLMTAHALPWLSIPLALFVGGVGAVSVVRAVYIDKRELKCACVGGSSRVPLGFVSLIENLAMVGMAFWMLWMQV
jgi:glutaredoxin